MNRYVSANARRKAWARAYRYRINQGLERCRKCGRIKSEMTWGHLVPASRGGTFVANNITILCRRCNRKQNDSIDPELSPLSSEPDFDKIVKEWAGERKDYPRGSANQVGGDLRDLPSTARDEHAPQEEGWAGLDSVQRAALMRIWHVRLSRDGDQH